jgi:serine/threonine protein kinase
MAQPPNSNPGAPPPESPRRRVELQDTLLLTDVPEAGAMIPEKPAPAPPVDAGSTLSPVALAALSQRYEILAEAGHGSMGNVYKARDRETGEIVALKLLKPEIASDQSMMERFKNELLFARKITHKNVCRVHEFNRIGGIAYTSMEFVEGDSLRSVLNRFGGLQPRKAIDLVAQMCSGLKEAHAQGIVHRDLKPENVMIDAQGNVKIMDFGIARSMEAVTKLTGSMVGTPAYMAPEQVGGKAVDYRTDIYSLGLIMYEVFTGAPAFQADNAVAVALKQMRESPVPPHEIEPAVPVAIERAILKCLEKEPAKRFQSIGELEAAMRAPGVSSTAAAASPALPHYSSHAAASPQFLRAAAAPKRSSPVVSILFVALLVIGAFAGFGAWQVWQRAENIPAPSLQAPAAPDFALDSSTAPSDAALASAPAPAREAAAPKTTAPAENKSAADNPARPVPADSAPAKQAPAPAAATPDTSSAKTENAARKPASGQYGENEPVDAPPVNDHTSSYLWVGRFEREDRAQATAKKIEDLGLPVEVIPRHGLAGDFFIVVTGPYGPERVGSAMEWLKTQGFIGVRLIKNPSGNEQQSSN